MQRAYKIIIRGRVQGVGFRPFVYRLAKKYLLTGNVHNTMDGVVMKVEGEEKSLHDFIKEVKTSPPRLSKINSFDRYEIQPEGHDDFVIISNENLGEGIPWIPADTAICAECLVEMRNPLNRRYQYPFINCTECGPRYTIIEKLPYQRSWTTMRNFPLCPECQNEYQDPSDRRYHAEPICCPNCGPTVFLRNHLGNVLGEDNDAISQTIYLIKEGKIVAIKGVGGYHLACDPTNYDVVSRIRDIKNRQQRPLAIMAKSLDVVKQFCHISSYEEDTLTSSEMPIVILAKKENSSLAENLSPGVSTLGVMLPYTPLHHLLLSQEIPCLVMTSANVSGQPILYQDDETTINRLRGLCDYIFSHNRPIYLPIDDSVVQLSEGKLIYIRRARGYTPEPIQTNSKVHQILALGGNQKNTFAIGKDSHIYLSPYIGDLDNEEMIQACEKQIHAFRNWLQIDEQYVVMDKHPFYESASIAQGLKGKRIFVQHHHAHHVSCMEDNGLTEPCLGIILDGTGYGEDGNIWGFECLYGNATKFERLGHLQYTPLPGGEKAVKEPWRNAVGMLLYYWGEEGKRLAVQLFPNKRFEINLIEQMMEKQINSPMAGTCGRLFDAVSAILDICTNATYEGEAAIKLADFMNGREHSEEDTYSYQFQTSPDKKVLLDFSNMLREIIQDKFQRKPTIKIIRKFHYTIVDAIVQMVQTIVKIKPELKREVVLSGGSFQNMYLVTELQKRLQDYDFTVYVHKKVPCHDGGLSMGQIIIAAETIYDVQKVRKR